MVASPLGAAAVSAPFRPILPPSFRHSGDPGAGDAGWHDVGARHDGGIGIRSLHLLRQGPAPPPYVAKDLPAPETVANREIESSSFIYDRKGRLLYEIFDPQFGRRQYV